MRHLGENEQSKRVEADDGCIGEHPGTLDVQGNSPIHRRCNSGSSMSETGGDSQQSIQELGHSPSAMLR